MTNRLRVVLDTNIVLAAISPKSSFRRIIDDFLLEKYTLYFTNDILLEYEEKLESNFSTDISISTIDLLLKQKNSRRRFTHYQLNLIPNDPDDNKFADCAFASNAHILVSNDKHLLQLNNLEFPIFNVLKATEFLRVLEGLV